MHFEGDNLMGEVEVLPTPSGNILKELFKAGIKLGISSRGMGSVETVNENGAESSELIDDQIKQKTLKVKMLDANSDQNTIESKYLNAWQRKIERVGHNVLKKEYSQLDLTQLRLVVSIDSLGNLIETKIIDSSGNSEIDKIAKEIVRLASPFEPFSDEMLSEYEVLQVDRIWKFGS